MTDQEREVLKELMDDVADCSLSGVFFKTKEIEWRAKLLRRAQDILSAENRGEAPENVIADTAKPVAYVSREDIKDLLKYGALVGKKLYSDDIPLYLATPAIDAAPDNSPPCEHEFQPMTEPHKECVKCGDVRRDWSADNSQAVALSAEQEREMFDREVGCEISDAATRGIAWMAWQARAALSAPANKEPCNCGVCAECNWARSHE